MKRSRNYSSDPTTQENRHFADKYLPTGESEFSDENAHPLDEVLSERHYNLNAVHPSYRDRMADQPSSTNERGPSRSASPRSFQPSDQTIREEVCEILLHAPEIDASELEVFVLDGEVRLIGTIENRRMKKLAERLIENLNGVFDVHNELKLRVDFPEREIPRGLVGDSPGLI